MVEKIIVKREPKRNGENLILFFPESFTIENRYQLQHWTVKDGYGYSLDKEYYNVCTPVDYSCVEIQKFVHIFWRYVLTLPDMNDYRIELVKRITKK